jgi:hypothetical protein
MSASLRFRSVQAMVDGTAPELTHVSLIVAPAMTS